MLASNSMTSLDIGEEDEFVSKQLKYHALRLPFLCGSRPSDDRPLSIPVTWDKRRICCELQFCHAQDFAPLGASARRTICRNGVAQSS
jgi:hypothetical protein